MAHAPVAGAPHYCAAKAAIEGFTRAVAVELASKQITVNALALGYFAYGLIEHVPNDIVEQIRQKIPFARLGDVREFASALLYLLSEDASYITGQTIHVNGGLYT
jgi:3-oxoacyl-[acyl-carrier protein] reductase